MIAETNWTSIAYFLGAGANPISLCSSPRRIFTTLPQKIQVACIHAAETFRARKPHVTFPNSPQVGTAGSSAAEAASMAAVSCISGQRHRVCERPKKYICNSKPIKFLIRCANSMLLDAVGQMNGALFSPNSHYIDSTFPLCCFRMTSPLQTLCYRACDRMARKGKRSRGKSKWLGHDNPLAWFLGKYCFGGLGWHIIMKYYKWNI